VKFKDLYSELYSFLSFFLIPSTLFICMIISSLKENGTRLDAFPGEEFTLCWWNSGGSAGHF
jgi:hypothetical protein